jgi:hypothetical protein
MIKLDSHHESGMITDQQGRFTIREAPPGEWWIRARWGACYPPDSTRIRVESASEMEVKFQLKWSYDYNCPCKPGADRSRLRQVFDYAWVCD